MVTHYGFLNNGYLGTLGQGSRKRPPLHGDSFSLRFYNDRSFGMFLPWGSNRFPSDTFDPIKAMTAIERERCTAIYAVPSMLVAMMEHPEFSRFNLSSLRTESLAEQSFPLN